MSVNNCLERSRYWTRTVEGELMKGSKISRSYRSGSCSKRFSANSVSNLDWNCDYEARLIPVGRCTCTYRSRHCQAFKRRSLSIKYRGIQDLCSSSISATWALGGQQTEEKICPLPIIARGLPQAFVRWFLQVQIILTHLLDQSVKLITSAFRNMQDLNQVV